jgi:hypothetical protein
MEEIHVPDLSPELIDALDKMFPEASADLRWTDREVWFKAGQRHVVRWLQEQYRRQQDSQLEQHTDVSQA